MSLMMAQDLVQLLSKPRSAFQIPTFSFAKAKRSRNYIVNFVRTWCSPSRVFEVFFVNLFLILGILLRSHLLIMVGTIDTSSTDPAGGEICVPDISASDASRTAMTLAKNTPWRFGGRMYRRQTTMHSLRFSKRIRAQYFIYKKPIASDTAKLTVKRAPLILLTDLRLYCVDAKKSLPFINLDSVRLVGGRTRLILEFRMYGKDHYDLLKTVQKPPCSQLVIDANEEVLRKFVASLFKSLHSMARARVERDLPVFDMPSDFLPTVRLCLLRYMFGRFVYVYKMC